MITKDNIASYFIELWAYTASSSVLMALSSGYDPLVGVLGTVGQGVAIGAKAVMKVREGRQLKKKPVWYWFVSLFVLAPVSAFSLASFISTTIHSDIVVGALFAGGIAQHLFDILLSVKDAIISKISGFGNEKDFE